MTNTAADQFEQYLIDEAWRAGIRDPDEVADFIAFWRNTSPAKRAKASLELSEAWTKAMQDVRVQIIEPFMSKVVSAFRKAEPK